MLVKVLFKLISVHNNQKEIKLSSKNNFSESATNRYALALYELAQENSELEKIENESLGILELIKKSLDFQSFIKNPTNEKSQQIKSIQMIAEKFGSCSNNLDCEAVCPKEISADWISWMNGEDG